MPRAHYFRNAALKPEGITYQTGYLPGITILKKK
jgi:hypothetical protein